jgi:hypothetical protein
MFRFNVWAVMLLAAFVFAAQKAKAGTGFQPISQDELKMTSEPLAPGAPAVILFHQVERDDNPYTGHEDQYYRIKILTEEGRQRADVEIPYLKVYAKPVRIHARTIRPDGTIVDFGGKVYEKEIQKGKFKGFQYRYMAKTFTLSDVEVGSILEYSYSIDLTENYIYDSQWLVGEDLFMRKGEFWLKPFIGNQFQGLTMHWTWQGLPEGVVPKKGADGIVRMEVSNVPAFQEEDFMPPPNELKARVDFLYEEGFSAKDYDAFWKSFGKQKNGQLESFVGKRSAMEQALSQIVSPNDPPDVKLRKIYDRVQQFRNTTNEFEKTEQEVKREKPPENVEALWQRGYGDREQLTWLFLALARAAGFEAYGCWVSSREEYFFKPKTMQSRKLNSNVVLVRLNGKDVYFEPGRAFTPFGLLAWQETSVPGLRLDKDGGDWIQTTLPPASESRIERAGKLKLSDTGSLEGKIIVTYTGLEAMHQRVEKRHADEVDRKKYLEERLMEQIGAAAEVDLTNKPDWGASETPLVAEFDVKIPGWASTAGRRVLTPAAIFTASEKGVFEHANRVHPIYFDYLFEKNDDVTIELPSGWQVSSVPPPQDQNVKVVAYSLKVEPGHGTMRLTRKLTVDIGLLDQKLYGPMRTFFQIVRTGDGEQVVLQPGEIHASN